MSSITWGSATAFAFGNRSKSGPKGEVVILVTVGEVDRCEVLAGALDEVSEIADVLLEVLGVDQNRFGRAVIKVDRGQ